MGRIAIICLALAVGLAHADEAEPAKDILRVAQMRGVPVKWDLEANFAVFVEQAAEAHEQNADVMITPECWLDGYAAPDEASTVEKLREVAQPLEGSEYLDEVARLADEYDMWICFGFISLEDDEIFNASGLWNREGKRVGMYHKTHIQTHDRQFAIGMGLPVFESEWGPLGMMICADRRWPETVRTLRVQGARLILNPTYGFWNELNEKIMSVRAWENQCFIAFTHPNQSLLVNPRGDVVGRVDSPEPGILVTEIDLSEAKTNNHLRDRRPELYGALSQGVYDPPNE